MNILWMCNIELPIVSEAMQSNVVSSGGWLDVLSRKIVDSGHNLSVVYPMKNIRTMVTKKVEGITIFQIPHKRKNNSLYDKSYESIFASILQDNDYNCIHIWGCEFPRSLAMLNACKQAGLLDKTILEIQGIRHFIARNYYASLPNKVIFRNRLRDIIYQSGIRKTKRLYETAGKYEINAIQTTKNIMGRTDWDYACVKSINTNLRYYKCNRVLRKSFYHDKWDINNYEKHSLLVSSYGTPVKGLHYVIEALPIILKEFPKTHLYIVGGPTGKPGNSLLQNLNLNSYGKHINDLIHRYNIEDNITFLGRLSEKEMVERFKNTHVYISASAMENSPNTVAEAMSLGVPVVASLVGGVSSLMDHRTEGFTYQYDAPYMMAHYVKEIFKSDKLASSLSENARKKAAKMYDVDTNYNCLLQAYKELSGSN